jgi:Tfp pilus assembly protein PilV
MGRHTSATRRSGRRLRQPGGYTLVESMIASALLATSVIGVSGTILSSYDHDQQSVQQASAIGAAESLMSELTALPFTAAAADDVGLMDFVSYSDTTTSGQANVATAKVAQGKGKKNKVKKADGTESNVVGDVLGLVGGLLGVTSSSSNSGSGSSSSGSGSSGSGSSSSFVSSTPTIAPVAVSRVATVARYDTLNGPVAAAGDLAIVTVTVDVTVGSGQVMRVRRLVSSTEAASGTAQ